MNYLLIKELSKAKAALKELSGRQVAFDLETTGLDPLSSEARLLSIASLSGGRTLVIDLFGIGGLKQLREELRLLRGIAHNAAFDLAFLTKADAPLALTDCTKIASHIVGSETGSLDLVTVAKKYLGRDVEKVLQTSGWGGDLSEDQIAYSAKDAELVRDLWIILQDQIRRYGSAKVYEIVRDALPAVVQMYLSGIPFDRDAHSSLVNGLQAELDTIKPKLIEALGGKKPSGKDLQAFLTEGLGGAGTASYLQWPRTKSGNQLSTTREDLSDFLYLLDSEYGKVVRSLLLPVLEIESVTKTFGLKLVDQLSGVSGRLHPNFSLTGTATGRLSSSSPNIQGFPRKAAFREIVSAPTDRTLVVADYNAMELRVAAQIAGETKLIEGFRDGLDPHRLTAAIILRKSESEVTKDERQLAKAVNFGLLFGQGPKGLSAYAEKTYGVKMSLDEAKVYREEWFAAYPAFKLWQTSHDRQSYASLSVKTPSGRVRSWTNREWGVQGGYKSTEAYNTPIQGGAAECILVAMSKIVKGLSERVPGAALIASVHDELIVECFEADGPLVARLLEDAMKFGFSEIFPGAPTNGLVEARVTKTWAKG
jgi:DNA polymerase-1